MQKAGKKNVYAGWVSGYWLVARGKQVGGVTVHTNTHNTQSVTTNTTTKAATNYNQQIQLRLQQQWDKNTQGHTRAAAVRQTDK